MAALNEKLATVTYDGYIIKPGEVGSIEFASGQTIKAGSIIDQNGKLLDTAGEGETVTASWIAAEDVDAREAAAVGAVYKTGVFAKNQLIVADEYTISATDVANLRDVGIILEDAVEA